MRIPPFSLPPSEPAQNLQNASCKKDGREVIGRKSCFFRDPNPILKPETPKKALRLRKYQKKQRVYANFSCLLPCAMNQERNRHCSEKRTETYSDELLLWV